VNADQFARRRGRIEHQADRSSRWRTKAMRQLVNEAGAVLMVAGHRVVGWRLPNGQVVCVKTRLTTEEAADDLLQQIARTDGTRPKRPVRSYPCQHCGGWHLTSQMKTRDAP
jgi:hypothetical protein